MKKFFSLLLTVFFVLLTTVALAAEPTNTMKEDELSIGGVGFETTLNGVELMFGRPDRKENFTANGQYIVRYYYGNKLIISAKAAQNFTGNELTLPVSSVDCRQPTLSTPSGFYTGMDFRIATFKYGKGELLPEGQVKDGIVGCKYYVYLVNGKAMTFAVDAAGIVQEISLRC